MSPGSSSQLPDGPSVDKRIFLDAPPFLDQGPDMAPDMAVDAALPDAPLPDKSCGTGKIACNCTYKGMASEAIFTWEGESLLISAPRPGAPRPTGFVKNSGQLLSLRRVGSD